MMIAVILGSWFLISVVTGLLIGGILHGAWWQEDDGQDGLPVRLGMSRAEFERTDFDGFPKRHAFTLDVLEAEVG